MHFKEEIASLQQIQLIANITQPHARPQTSQFQEEGFWTK